jgi:hypothetical protein
VPALGAMVAIVTNDQDTDGLAGLRPDLMTEDEMTAD